MRHQRAALGKYAGRKLTENRLGFSPEAAARKLFQIILRADIDVGQISYTGITNSAFTREGGTIAESSAGIAFGTEYLWFKVDRSGTRLVLFQGSRRIRAIVSTISIPNHLLHEKAGSATDQH